ncbi:microfibril-associated glycoprotein 4-like isoform X2 [Ruditapes philippinarum]|uniref:microfibril-associated glycoprotein 4-like isoform X2 n=1 Tax=Ruditapes philippinarum TaxID=129788 RepID=UPI00295B73C7|nr:microfibril-associated glycoprotein 4-like isoform X2 [Ruditapes philippinarum]
MDTAKEIYTELASRDNRTEQGRIYDTVQHGTGELADKTTPSAKKCTPLLLWCTLVHSILIGLLIIAVSVSLYISTKVSKASNSKVDGGWSEWNPWRQCSVPCGVGLQSRTRLCTNASPANDGKQCVGQNFEVKLCYHEDCYAIKKRRGKLPCGIYNVRLWNTGRVIPVHCDFNTDTGGWTVFQYRFNGSVDFYRNFSDYERGFGSLDGEFWLGLQNIYEMVFRGKTELRLDLTAADGTSVYETFQNFRLGERPYYTLHIDKGVGTAGAGDGSSYHNGSHFSTFDMDRDGSSDRNCAIMAHGGWWYDNCAMANLNGEYVTPGTQRPVKSEGGMIYYPFRKYESLKISKMMFRRV